MKTILQGLTGRPSLRSSEDAKDPRVALEAACASRRIEILDDYEQAGIGWIWATDAEGALIYISKNAVKNLGVPIEEILGQPLAKLFDTERENPDEKSDRPLNFQLRARSKISDLTVRLNFGAFKDEGRRTWWSISGQPKFDQAGQFQGYRGSAKDVTLEFSRKLEDSRLAQYDSLTGLANRHRLDTRLTSILASYKAAKRSCALLMLDLDRFKQVNDTMGHQVGDELLKQVARRLERIIGDRGEIGRLGGDEFQVILPNLEDRGKLGELAGKVIQMVTQPYRIDDKHATIGTSVGIAIAPYDGVEKHELVHNADLALYAAKNGGRGQFRFYSADLKDEAEERRLVEDDLSEALANDQLELHYQPVVRTLDNMVVGFEALMRWEHPERGHVSPEFFIPIAEESNLINRLGEWALRRACHDAAQWPEAVSVAVNVSALQFTNSGFPTVVRNALAASGMSPARLELELTESVFIGDSESTDSTFKMLKGLGIRLVLDDFGTGYSSLSYLRSAPFDKIKVDKCFVDSCTQEGVNSAKIIAAIIGLSDALEMDTVVEGVEAFDQLQLVCAKGARFIQGYIFSKPLRFDEVQDRMASGQFQIEPEGPETYRANRRSVFRRIGVIHEDHRYEAVMRELSTTGARIEGLLGVSIGTGLVIDLGAGQLAVSTVTRSEDAAIAVEFETPLVSDGAGGLCTRHRVSPYLLAAAGMPLTAFPPGQYPITLNNDGPATKPQFMQVEVSKPELRSFHAASCAKHPDGGQGGDRIF